jgi:hypothetical protein
VLKSSDFLKIHPLGDELFHADGQTDMAKLIFAFRKFARATRNDAIVQQTTDAP